MLTLTNLTGFGAGGTSGPPQFLYDHIVAAGLTSGLQLCLDAGDSRCYDGSGQIWSDCSGNGHNFERGSTSSSESVDPGWTGSIGSWSDSTYFTFDGTQYFTPTSFHTFAQPFHKNNGAFSIVALFYAPTFTGVQRIFATSNEAPADAGMSFRFTNANPVLMRSITTTTRELRSPVAVITANSWNFAGCAYNEATPSLLWQINGTAETDTAPTASTDTDNHPNPMAIGNRPDLSVPLANGHRLAALAIWNTALSAGNLTSLYNAAKVRIPALP